jgi:hypothetical protein
MMYADHHLDRVHNGALCGPTWESVGSAAGKHKSPYKTHDDQVMQVSDFYPALSRFSVQQPTNLL